jgi:hypothetical protein
VGSLTVLQALKNLFRGGDQKRPENSKREVLSGSQAENVSTDCDDPSACPQWLHPRNWTIVGGFTLICWIGSLFNAGATFADNVAKHPIFLLISIACGVFALGVRIARRHLLPLVPRDESVRAVNRALNDLKVKLGEERAPTVLAAIAELMTVWAAPVQRLTRAESLSGDMLQSYVSALSNVKHPRTGIPLNLSNFEIYATCVETMLERLAQPNSEGHRTTIKVSTVLRRDLKYWYNIGQTRRGDISVAFTTESWEDYKAHVARIVTTGGSQPHDVQMRRIVDRRALASAKSQFIYCDDQGPAKLTALDLHTLVNQDAWKPECLTLVEEIANLLKVRHFRHAIYAIAEHDQTACPGGRAHHQWHQLLWDFGERYHNAAHAKGSRVPVADKGVFYTFVDIDEDFEYEDVFIVDMLESGGGRFGVGFYRDELERPGIAVLAGGELEEIMAEVDKLWEAGGEFAWAE